MMENPVGDDDTDIDLMQQMHELEAFSLQGMPFVLVFLKPEPRSNQNKLFHSARTRRTSCW